MFSPGSISRLIEEKYLTYKGDKSPPLNLSNIRRTVADFPEISAIPFFHPDPPFNNALRKIAKNGDFIAGG